MSKPKFKDLILEICLKYGKDDFMWSFLNRLYFTNLAKKTLPFHNNRHKIYELMLVLNGREKYEKGDVGNAEQEKDFDFIVNSIADLMKENGIMQAISQQSICDEINLCMRGLGLKVKTTESKDKILQNKSSSHENQTIRKKMPPFQYLEPISFIEQLFNIKDSEMLLVSNTIISIVQLCLDEEKNRC